LLGPGIEKIRIEGFRMIALIIVDVIELVKLKAIPIDEIIDYVLEIVLFRGLLGVVEEVEGHSAYLML
jgi:prenyltransferase beta subunit